MVCSKIFFWKSISIMFKMLESGKLWFRRGNDYSVRGDSIFVWLILMRIRCCVFTECFYFRRVLKLLSFFKSFFFIAKLEIMSIIIFSNNLCFSCRLY